MERHHKTHEVKFSCRTILKDVLAENVIKQLQINKKHIAM